MTCIVADVRTKRELKMILDNPDGDVMIEDPSIMAPFTGRLSEYIDRHGECYLTNHPKRSWFARVTRKNGKLKVE
jgi:hypothetical protein